MCAGQLVVASLLSRNIKVRLILRDPDKATSLFGEQDEEKFQVQLAFFVLFTLAQATTDDLTAFLVSFNGR